MSLAQGDKSISTARRFKYNALIIMSTRVHDAPLSSRLLLYEPAERCTVYCNGRSGRTCLSNIAAADREWHRARVMVGGAIDGVLSASGMIACEGHI